MPMAVLKQQLTRCLEAHWQISPKVFWLYPAKQTYSSDYWFQKVSDGSRLPKGLGC